MNAWSRPAALLVTILPMMQSLPAAATGPAPIYADLRGEVVLENERVLVEKFVLQPGQATGAHAHPADQLQVFVHGGVLASVDTGRETLWRDGSVSWHAAGSPGNGGSRNAGTAPIVMMWVTVKPHAAAKPAAPGSHRDLHLNYPNIPGEDLLENDRVIVQRFVVGPGQWEGVHAHVPNMLYIHIKGGQWAARSKHEAEHVYPDFDPDGAVGWMKPVDLSEGHESGNAGKEPIDLIWVTLKD